MASIKKFNVLTNKWEVFGSTDANQVCINDLSKLFDSKNVEGALSELAREQKNIANDIEWLKLNGGGGGGSGPGVAPTITSSFENNGIVNKDEDIIIPIFFNSLNYGNGLAYISINNIQKDAIPIKQGNNLINIGKLTDLNNTIAIYAKDRTGALSNQLTWNIKAGGIDFVLDFDYNTDYTVLDEITMKYSIQTVSTLPIILHLSIGSNHYEILSEIGSNEYTFPQLNVGVYTIKMKFVSGEYSTSEKIFNLVVVSSDTLYLSTSFENSEFEYGFPIIVDYRISKNSKEIFDIFLILNGLVQKELQAPSGAYSWALNDVPVGTHTLKIEVVSKYGERTSFEKTVTIIQGDYTPLEINTQGLVYRLSALGRTNNDVDKELPEDLSGNNTLTQLHNFNFFTNGWINGALVCDGNAHVEIDCYPWMQNAMHGSTIEIHYKALDIGKDDARILDYTDTETPFKGAYVSVNECVAKSIANTATSYLNKDDWITISFVIDRKNKFYKTYIDGICSRAFYLSDSGSGTTTTREDFTHSSKIYLNSKKGLSHFGACEIKDIRIYNRSLSDDEILKNYIAQEKRLNIQRADYLFNYENASVPVIQMYGDTTNMTLETPVQMRIKYTSPNEDLYGHNFDLPYCDVNWQGTSSLQYVLKNYTIKLKDLNMAPYKYSPYKDGIPETIFCLKCDYMESSHARNVGIAKFVNDSLYDTKNPAQLKNEKYRNSINGFPILVYINDVLQGVYNFNLDRYSVESFGYNEFSQTLVYEVSANSDTTAGAFFKWMPQSGKSEIDYYKSDFRAIYPPTRVAGNDNYSEIIRLVKWVNDASDEDFRSNFRQYFNLEYTIRYYLTVMIFGAVDSLGKNMKLATFDGLIWYPQFYDIDTCLGLDNTGFLKFDADIEIGDEGVFNTTSSILWKKIRLLFAEEIKQQYSLMRQGKFTLSNIMKYLFEQQVNVIPKRFYNWDTQKKYLDFQSSYLYALHGNSYHHIKKWITERLIYVDTLIGYTTTTADYITIRSSKLGEVFLDIETYTPLYLRVKWREEANNTGTQIKRIGRGEKVRFSYNMPTATDQEILIYGGHYLKSIGDVSNLQPTTMLIANADRLTEITCHSPNLINTDLNICTKLQTIDLSDCVALGTGIGAQPILNIQQCKYLRSVNVFNTAITAVYTMAAGGNLEEMYLSKTAQSIVVSNQKHLRVIGIPYDKTTGLYCKNLSTVSIENCENIKFMHYPFSTQDSLHLNALKFVQTLSLVNSLNDLTSLSFLGFEKLNTLTISSMKFLSNLGFVDMSPVNIIPTLSSIRIGDCPLITDIRFETTNSLYKIAFVEGSMLDLSGLQSLQNISNNCEIQGLETLKTPNSVVSISFSNTSIKKLDIGINDSLRVLRLSDCNKLSDVLDLSGCNSLQELYTVNTNLKEIKFSTQNTVLKTLVLPTTLTHLSLINKPNIKTYQCSSYQNLTHLRFENTLFINPIHIINNAPKLRFIRLINLSARTDYVVMRRIMELSGLGSNNLTTSLSNAVSGEIVLIRSSEILLNTFVRTFPLVTFKAEVIVPQYLVTFCNYNGTVLYETSVLPNDNVIYIGNTPTRPADAQFDYTFKGWNKSIENITEDTIVTAVFNQQIKSYTIRFINGDTLEVISTQTIEYGSIPIEPSFPEEHNRWDSFVEAADSNKDYISSYISYPQDLTIFTFTRYLDGYSVSLNEDAAPEMLIYPFAYNKKYVHQILQPRENSLEKRKIKNIFIPQNITHIGNYAFQNFGIKTISISDSVTTFGNSCFEGCTSLTSIIIPKNVTSIGNNCFKECSSLTEIKNMSKKQQTIGVNAFLINPLNLIYAYGYSTNTTFKSTIDDSNNIMWIEGVPNVFVSLGESVIGEISTETKTLFIKGSGIITNWNDQPSPLMSYSNSIVDVTMSDKITQIGANTFKNCTLIKSMSLSPSILTLGAESFSGCSSLSSLTLPRNIKTIQDYCFKGCNSLTNIINDSVFSQTIAINAFDITPNTRPIPVHGHNSNTVFKDLILQNTSKFTWTPFPVDIITLGAKVQCILDTVTGKAIVFGEGKMNNIWTYDNFPLKNYISIIKTVEIQEGVLDIGNYCFYGCNKLTSATLPNSMQFLGNYCFSSCASLTTIILPNNLNTIGKGSFYGCNGLASITNKSRLAQSIDSSAFELQPTAAPIPVFGYTTNLSFRTLLSNKDYFSWNEFPLTTNATMQLGANIQGLLKTDGELTITGTGEMYSNWTHGNYPLKDYIGHVKVVNIENGVTSIGNYCFCDCIDLVSISIPDSITSLKNHCFKGCLSLSSVDIPANIISLGDYCFSSCKALTSIIIPNSVTAIGVYCFNDCIMLSSVTLPNTITKLKHYCFNNCISLSSINLPNSITALETYCFANCSLISIQLPDTMLSIGDYCFSTCVSLASIILPNSITTVGSYCFSTCIGLTSIKISSSLTIISNSCFYNCRSLTTIEIPNGVTKIGASAFEYCQELSSISIPNTVTIIDNYCFEDCSSLKTIIIPDSVKHIGNYCFQVCKNLTSVTLPKSLSIISEGCFAFCSSLSTINLPPSIIKIGSSCFYGCNKLDQITIPENLSIIESHCFRDCLSLSSITIPANIITLGAFSFYNCSGLSSITNKAISSQTIEQNAFNFETLVAPIPVYGYSSNMTFKTAMNDIRRFTWNELS